jgi:hypothetical protein
MTRKVTTLSAPCHLEKKWASGIGAPQHQILSSGFYATVTSSAAYPRTVAFTESWNLLSDLTALGLSKLRVSSEEDIRLPSCWVWRSEGYFARTPCLCPVLAIRSQVCPYLARSRCVRVYLHFPIPPVIMTLRFKGAAHLRNSPVGWVRHKCWRTFFVMSWHKCWRTFFVLEPLPFKPAAVWGKEIIILRWVI